MATTTLDDIDFNRLEAARTASRAQPSNQEWIKMTKGQSLLCSFLYFHPVDVNAVKPLRCAKRAPRREEIQDAATAALTERAKLLSKPVEQLTQDERLDLNTVQFKSFKAHYQEGLGYALSRLGRDGAEADAVWRQLPEAKQYFTTLLLVYPMTREGEHDVKAIERGQWRIQPWRFGPPVYDDIWNVNDGLRKSGSSVAHHDLALRCTDTNYQTIRVSVHGPALWRSNDRFKVRILTEAIEYYDQIVPFRAVTTDQLRKKLSIGGRMLEGVGDDVTHLFDET